MGSFEHCFGAPREGLARARGRLNLIGEPSEYNQALVLPVLVPQYTQIEIRARGDSVVRLVSPTLDSETFTYQLGHERLNHHWADCVQGATRALAQERFSVGGFDALVTSTVPISCGLASSTAFLVALMKALRETFSLDLSDLRLARSVHRVENDLVGLHIDILDPMVISLGDSETALFIDTQAFSYRKVPMLNELTELVVIHAGLPRRHVAGGNHQRRSECEAACRQLGVSSLRMIDDVTRLERLPEPLRRRARHVVTENRRVLAAVDALEAGDALMLGAQLIESHCSLRDDYEASMPALDALVDFATAESGVFGARLAGGEHGSSILALVRRGEGARIARHVVEEYGKRFPHVPTVLLPSSL